MADVGALLTALQHGDSFFPGGQLSFSWGLEGLCADDRIASADDLEAFVLGQLRHRWACSDRGILAAAYRAGDDLDAVAYADRLQEAMALGALLRQGSRRVGGALLTVHEGLGTLNAAEYRERVAAGEAPGHLAAVQGLLFRGVGLALEEACAVSAHGFCVALVGAALRLGLIGHLHGQRQLKRLRPVMVELIARPIPELEGISAYGPSVDIAIMRHETRTTRLFSN